LIKQALFSYRDEGRGSTLFPACGALRLIASTSRTITGAAVQAYSRPAISVGGSGVHFIELTAGCSHQAHPSL